MTSFLQTFTVGSAGRSALVLVGSAILFFYVAFQARLLIAGPSLTLAEDSTRVRYDTRVITLIGTARTVTEITLNDRPIFTDDNGVFREPLVLENRYTVATLRAKDRYGRKTVLEQAFVYTPISASSTPQH